MLVVFKTFAIGLLTLLQIFFLYQAEDGIAARNTNWMKWQQESEYLPKSQTITIFCKWKTFVLIFVPTAYNGHVLS